MSINTTSTLRLFIVESTLHLEMKALCSIRVSYRVRGALGFPPSSQNFLYPENWKIILPSHKKLMVRGVAKKKLLQIAPNCTSENYFLKIFPGDNPPRALHLAEAISQHNFPPPLKNPVWNPVYDLWMNTQVPYLVRMAYLLFYQIICQCLGKPGTHMKLLNQLTKTYTQILWGSGEAPMRKSLSTATYLQTCWFLAMLFHSLTVRASLGVSFSA